MRKHILILGLFLALLFTLGGFALAAQADETECVPKPAWTETIEHAAVTEDKQVVLDPGSPAVAGQHYSWNGGPLGVDTPPTVVPPHPDWQANTSEEPHDTGQGATWINSNLHVMGNSPVNASWFYYQPGKDEVPPTYGTVTEVVEEARTEIIEHPAVVCGPTIPTVTPTDTVEIPTVTPTPGDTDEPSQPPVQPVPGSPDDNDPQTSEKTVPVAVPTAVAAGLAAGDSGDEPDVFNVLVGLGALAVLIAAVAGFFARRR